MTLDLDAIKARIPKYGGGDMRALVAEVERLRAEVADLRDRDAERLLDNEHAYEEGYDAGTRRGYEAECAAVVAWLRGRPGYGPVADSIEEGEHRREEER